MIAHLIEGGAGNLVSSFSFTFLGVFLPFSVILYGLCPRKFRSWLLLLISWGFFALICRWRIVFLLISICSVYFIGLWLDNIGVKRKTALKAADKSEKKALKQHYIKRQRWVLFFGVLINIGLLLVIKYAAFFITNLNTVLAAWDISRKFNVPAFIMPIGISFYSLQAVSYLMDIHRGTLRADHHFGRVALFLSFFPQIVEGPICRYHQTAEQLWEPKSLNFEHFKFGCIRILYGMMKKIVIADRLNAFVQTIFDGYSSFSGGIVALSAFAYTIQLYMDFSGAMDVAIGTGEIFGVTMPENFRQPFFSKSVSEFWQRWHISLGAWFKDYIFYPIALSKPMKNLTVSARKKLGNHFGPLIQGSIALLCVWFCNGLWHGSDWNFIFFGLYHFVMILIGNIIQPFGIQWRERLNIREENKLFRAFQILRTGIFVVIGELFFRAEGLSNGLNMFKQIFTDFTFPAFTADLSSALSIDGADILIIAVTLIIVFFVSLNNEKGICLREKWAERSIGVRWIILYALILFIIIFGAYGLGYAPVDPMYANF